MEMNINKEIRFYKLYYFTYCFAYGSFFPILGLYLKTAAHMRIEQVGTIMAAAPLVSLLCQPLWGVLNQSFGISRKAIQIGLMITSLLQIAILFSKDFSLVLPLYVAFCIINCCYFPFHDGITSIFAKNNNRQFGEIRIWGAIGWSVSTFITGYIVQYMGYKTVGFMALFIYWIAIFSFSRTNKIDVRSKDKKERPSFISLIRNRDFMILMGVIALGNGSVIVSDYFMNIKLYSLGALESQIGFANSFSVFTEIIFMLIATKIFQKRFSPFQVLSIGVFFMASYLILLGISGNYILALGVTGIRGVAMGFYIPTVILCASSLIKTAEVPSAVIFYNCIGTGLYPFLLGNTAGYLQGFISLDIVLFALGIAALCSFFIIFRLSKKLSKNQIYVEN